MSGKTLSAKEAAGRFKELLSEQKGCHNQGDIERVACQGIEKLRARSGTEERQGVVDTSTMDPFTHEVKRRKLLRQTSLRDVKSRFYDATSTPARSLASSSATLQRASSKDGKLQKKQEPAIQKNASNTNQGDDSEELRQLPASQLSPQGALAAPRYRVARHQWRRVEQIRHEGQPYRDESAH